MDFLIFNVAAAFQIALLDIVLSGDNIGVIALAVKNLPEKYAKRASALGVFIAVTLRIIFASLITYILMIQWLPIKLAGGLMLVKITFDLLKSQNPSEDREVRSSARFMEAVKTIIIADAAMSLDNVLAIAGAADGNIILIIFGLLFNIPIILYGSRYAAKVMTKHPIVVYVGGAVLAHTAFKMLLEDKLLTDLVPAALGSALPNLAAMATLVYGIVYLTWSENKYVKNKN